MVVKCGQIHPPNKIDYPTMPVAPAALDSPGARTRTSLTLTTPRARRMMVNRAPRCCCAHVVTRV
eukprot:4110881-Prymnesium_polylepis.1